MDVFQLRSDCLEKEYHGCGKAWAAIKDGQVVALRYMGDYPLDWRDQPEWIKAFQQAAIDLGECFLLTTNDGSTKLAAIAAAAEACADCPRPPRHRRYRPTELLTMARAARAAAEAASFQVYRARCREELAQLGEVKSGMCSCHEFCAD